MAVDTTWTDSEAFLTANATTLAAPASGGGTMTFPSGSDTVASIAATQTLTNKTLTSPVLTSPSMTTPTLGIATPAGPAAPL